VLEECITDKEEVLVFTWESALVYYKVTFLMTGFIKILLWIDFKDIITHLETDWLQFRGNVFAAFLDVAESLVSGAVKVWKSLLPLDPNLFKNIRRNRELRRASVNNSRVRSILTWFLHWLSTVEHTLSLKSPGTEPVLKVLECF